MVTNRDTRIYQRPTTASRYVSLPAGTALELLAINGAAAHLCKEGDKVIIMCYASLTPEEVRSGHRPRVVFVDENNRPVRITEYEKHGLLEDMP